ncbi:uncharacterized protein AMSG_09664 [Thecamonas trahens ATCC 50062]|uniref:Uncharacterized protein n=1 Tax=Thecamonas trahens ATCC 50062 TaxID=461836 RepID=A0A0L0DNW9_THETB|nr:hypothetical protein AMSG_09664 [Thecamonas trahens ATCC 50062]KNC54009.1 hypothetical protein AMSG_09664 [Thecamonas trahens ATCC 50062]|eukprot:XP_013754024.1 hypothetical protein AMSG_09664 [Thecamonas trahens ATCC 50062]
MGTSHVLRDPLINGDPADYFVDEALEDIYKRYDVRSEDRAAFRLPASIVGGLLGSRTEIDPANYFKPELLEDIYERYDVRSEDRAAFRLPASTVGGLLASIVELRPGDYFTDIDLDSFFEYYGVSHGSRSTFTASPGMIGAHSRVIASAHLTPDELNEVSDAIDAHGKLPMYVVSGFIAARAQVNPSDHLTGKALDEYRARHGLEAGASSSFIEVRRTAARDKSKPSETMYVSRFDSSQNVVLVHIYSRDLVTKAKTLVDSRYLRIRLCGERALSPVLAVPVGSELLQAVTGEVRKVKPGTTFQVRCRIDVVGGGPDGGGQPRYIEHVGVKLGVYNVNPGSANTAAHVKKRTRIRTPPTARLVVQIKPIPADSRLPTWALVRMSVRLARRNQNFQRGVIGASGRAEPFLLDLTRPHSVLSMKGNATGFQLRVTAADNGPRLRKFDFQRYGACVKPKSPGGETTQHHHHDQPDTRMRRARFHAYGKAHNPISYDNRAQNRLSVVLGTYRQARPSAGSSTALSFVISRAGAHNVHTGKYI